MSGAVAPDIFADALACPGACTYHPCPIEQLTVKSRGF